MQCDVRRVSVFEDAVSWLSFNDVRTRPKSEEINITDGAPSSCVANRELCFYFKIFLNSRGGLDVGPIAYLYSFWIGLLCSSAIMVN